MLKNKFVLIGLVVVLLLATAGGTWFIASSNAPVEVAEGAEGEKAVKEKELAKPVLYSLDPSFVVNLLNERGTRFLQVDVQVMSRDEKAIDRVKEHEVQIRHELIMMFSSLTRDMIVDRQGREAVQQQTVDSINRVLKAQVGKAGVDAVYFTKFVVQ